MQKKMFNNMVKNVASLTPSVRDFIYKELALDASSFRNPVMEERLRLISLGHTDIIADHRHLNPGRPAGFDTFFTALQEVVEEMTAVDDRRHGEAHLSNFISLRDLMEQASRKCPPETPIPSGSLVRFQFAPKNPYCRAALRFTSKINVCYKIQRRQLRLAHVDAHFANAQFKYLKEFAVENKEQCSFVCCDEKSKIPIGEPGQSVSTGVRGKKSIVPTNMELVALDHDMTKCSLTPSVVLECEIPASVQYSFVQGQVTTVLNDSVFQSASPFRHSTLLVKLLSGNPKPVLLKFTDGGTDQRNTLESVRIANICVFRELGLDLLIHARCAPGQSFTNPAERIMSILNLGLQNVSIERNKTPEKVERLLKQKNSMAEIRKANVEHPDYNIRTESVEPVQALIRNRFSRLKLKDTPVEIMDPVSDMDIDILQRHIRELFLDLDVNKLQKTHTKKSGSYQRWIEQHCKLSHYLFQIRKCEDRACCPEPVVNISFLPDAVLSTDGEHYKPYSEVKGIDTIDKDRPSLAEKGSSAQKTQRKTSETVTQLDLEQTAQSDPLPTIKLTSEPTAQLDPKSSAHSEPELTAESVVESADDMTDDFFPEYPASLFTVQNARSLVTCIECRKPRVVYSSHKLTERQQMMLALSISEYDYTCGAPLLPPSCPVHKKCTSRINMGCVTPIELAYYKSGLGLANMCCYCCGEGEVLLDLLKKYKTVLPICKPCQEKGLKPVAQRPYGK